jgi:hypothetical protein
MYTTATEPISTVYFINPSHQSVCIRLPPNVPRQTLGKVYPPFIASQRLGKHVSAATNIPDNRRIVGRGIFYTIHTLSKEGFAGSVHPSVVTRYQVGTDVPWSSSMRSVSYQSKVGD